MLHVPWLAVPWAVAEAAPNEFDPDEEAPAPPAPAAPAAPASDPVTAKVPALSALTGTWYVTAGSPGAERVEWACAGRPTTIDFDEDTLVVTVGGETLGGAVRGTAVRGEALVLTTTLEACTGSKEVSVRWADDAHQILEIARCEGSPRTVRAVRNVASGAKVVRQCCEPGGRALKYVDADAPCPTGSDGQKPTPLRR